MPFWTDAAGINGNELLPWRSEFAPNRAVKKTFKSKDSSNRSTVLRMRPKSLLADSKRQLADPFFAGRTENPKAFNRSLPSGSLPAIEILCMGARPRRSPQRLTTTFRLPEFIERGR